MVAPLKYRNWVRRIREAAEAAQSLTDDQLRDKGLALRYRAACGARETSLIVDAFPLVIESARRILGQTMYDVQIEGGIQLARGRIVEMKTGEGKTLTATLPAFLFGLSGRGAHVVTVNDYLARRDREEMGPIYERLGLTVGMIQSDHSPQQRALAYRRDITYATAKEIGFDFLRDRLAAARKAKNRNSNGAATVVHRDFHFALVDEADSILIDEARTPLIIGLIDEASEQQKRECYLWSAQHAPTFVEKEHYKYEHEKRQVKLNPQGWKHLRDLPQTRATRAVNIRQLSEFMETAIKANRDFKLDQHYAKVDGKIVIIDEFTGRPAEGRQWQRGLHQAIESKEQVEITPATNQAATITVQSLFKLFPKFSGMTGTAWTSRREFRKVYRRRVVRIPTHRPVCRTRLKTRIFSNQLAKFHAVVDEVRDLLAQQRAILIGTRSVDKSEFLSGLIEQAGIEHRVLNARHLEREADIVAMAGQSCRVTIATNMAGRGTDIKLDEQVRKNGGLHVILTEIHEAARIDWQLIGRASRQGDKGSYRIFVSLDDEIIRLGLGPRAAARLLSRYRRKSDVPADAWRYFRKAQHRLERRYLSDRMILMEHEKQRREQYFDTGQDPYLDVAQS